MIKNQLTKDECRSLFDYDAELGVLRRKISSAKHIKVGEIAGSRKPNKKGYFEIEINGKNYKRHNLIWNWHNGLIPEGKLVDHRIKTMSGGKDKIENLQLLSNRQNIIKDMFAKGESAYIGVHKRENSKKFRSCIRETETGKTINLGTFETEIEAAKAYDEAALIYHGFYAQLNFPEPDPYWFDDANERMSPEDIEAMKKAAR